MYANLINASVNGSKIIVETTLNKMCNDEIWNIIFCEKIFSISCKKGVNKVSPINITAPIILNKKCIATVRFATFPVPNAANKADYESDDV